MSLITNIRGKLKTKKVAEEAAEQARMIKLGKGEIQINTDSIYLRKTVNRYHTDFFELSDKEAIILKDFLKEAFE